MSYPFESIEPKWQAFWEKNQTFKTPDSRSKPKYYVLDMFPYPSGQGLHVGHPEGYTATDIVARYKRAKGFNVLHPMGWDAFGLPAEQHAIQTGVHPATTTQQAIENFRRQLKMLGFSYDWDREIATCTPEYYKWTQAIFLQLYEKGLAYKKDVPVNWCPALKTVLANEEVIDGKSERGGHPVFRVPMRQWMLKITAYAERLLQDLDQIDWPESTKELQRNWIGKSEGLQLSFAVSNRSETVSVFTTRPDTLWGVTYLVLAPEHPLVEKITTSGQQEKVKAYQTLAAQKSEISRQEQGKEKTGVWTGANAIHPITRQQIPVWVADYVMMGYGTGAVMAVPAHDERDHAFAQAFALPILEVVQRPADFSPAEAYPGHGIAMNSGFIDGLQTLQAKEKVIQWAEEQKVGKRTVLYKLRDWLFSRQRYWGEPFPILYDENGQPHPADLNSLPVTLPSVQSYEPTGTGESPLAAITGWVEVKDPKSGKIFKRETDTMPGSAGSSWYFLRYIDPHNSKEAFSKEAEKYWMPVDLYLGGAEHAVGHLLYSRFWMKVLFDAGLVSHPEPFQKLYHQGMILGMDGEKMSKSRGNVINPDDVVKNYGADTLRMYEMFMGPLDRDKPWSTSAIEGVFRFLQRAWRIFVDDQGKVLSDATPATDADLKVLHKTIAKVTDDIEQLRFNTAISQMMIFVNHFTKEGRHPIACLKPFVQLLHPFAPHMGEELWQRIGEKEALSYAKWPDFDPQLAKEDLLQFAVQILGKTRAVIPVEPDTSQIEVEAKAKADPAISRHLEGKTVKKVIFVPNKIINFIVS